MGNLKLIVECVLAFSLGLGIYSLAQWWFDKKEAKRIQNKIKLKGLNDA